MKPPTEPIQQNYMPIDYTKVEIADTFWAPRIETIRNITMPHSYIQLKNSNRIDAFRLNWKPGDPNRPHIFWDSDLAKWIESAALVLRTKAIPELAQKMEEAIDLIIKAQQPNGYLNVYFTVVEPNKRFTNLRDMHELYCAGHLIEAAVEHYKTTGKRHFLDALCKYADYIDSVFGNEEGKLRGYPGHEEIELALVKLYHATGNKKYFNLAKYFIDQRGQDPDYFMEEALKRGEKLDGLGFSPNPSERILGKGKDPRYWQNHLPVREQDEIVGHAVRAQYLFSGMVDVALETGDRELMDAAYALWEDTTYRKMYITGGVGSSRENEGMTVSYDLPNESAYAETCAAIALIFWTYRLLQYDLDGRFADIIEKTFYNGMISGLSLSGDHFFYENPLAVLSTRRDFKRVEWFGCACCPNNITRLVATLGQYIYSTRNTDIIIHQYLQNSATLSLGKAKVLVSQTTNYPWDGVIGIKISPENDAEPNMEIGLRLRVPGWCEKFTLTLVDASDKESSLQPKNEKGYIRVSRRWEPGDKLKLTLEMPIQRMHAHPKVEADWGRFAFQRGPIVYCIEEADNGRDLAGMIIPPTEKFETKFDPNLLGGVGVLHGTGFKQALIKWGEDLYAPEKSSLQIEPIKVKAIPYCVWNNRAPGEMQVWIRE